MSDQVAVAVIAGAVGVAAALIAAWQAARARRENRVSHLEGRIADEERENRLLWLWCRQLIDHVYRGEAPPPPAAPPGLFEKEEHK